MIVSRSSVLECLIFTFGTRKKKFLSLEEWVLKKIIIRPVSNWNKKSVEHYFETIAKNVPIF